MYISSWIGCHYIAFNHCTTNSHKERKDEIEKLKPRFLIFDEIFKSINFKKQKLEKTKRKHFKRDQKFIERRKGIFVTLTCQ